jgi:REP element-mobilizing transposase RayT
MGMRKVSFVPGEYYHIYNRGNSKQKIFNSKGDCERFLKLLYLANSPAPFHYFDIENPYNIKRPDKFVSIGAYCLMPNHFHLLITPSKASEEGISKFMKKLGTAYSMYFNTRYERVGSLFEGKFKSEHLDSDRYLKYIFSYIHLNPLKIMDKDWRKNGILNTNKAWKFLSKYKYSSFQDYVDTERIEAKILDRNDFPDYFPSTKSFKSEILDWISAPSTRKDLVDIPSRP